MVETGSRTRTRSTVPPAGPPGAAAAEGIICSSPRRRSTGWQLALQYYTGGAFVRYPTMRRVCEPTGRGPAGWRPGGLRGAGQRNLRRRRSDHFEVRCCGPGEWMVRGRNAEIGDESRRRLPEATGAQGGRRDAARVREGDG